MSDFQTFATSDKHNRMLTDYLTTANRMKPNGFTITGTG
jgi:hypothetical protein